MNVKVYNQEGKEVGSVDLKDEVFGVEPKESLVHQYIVNYLARQRQGNASTKTRTDVRGGGRKPWRQKGTGRARAGTTRSPLWRGGGTVFGPQPRSYGSKLPQKMKRQALQSILSDKAARECIRVVDEIKFEKPRTQDMVNVISKLELDGKKCLVLEEGVNKSLELSCRNLQKVLFTRASLANGYDMLNADILVITKAGLEKVQEVFS
ncbi:MAG: 50S ribosomal protein L4 [bacterium]|nr:50S ribosomal protein L4 [bacterium]